MVLCPPYTSAGISYPPQVARFLTSFLTKFLTRFLTRFLTMFLTRVLGSENTVYSSTGTEKYSVQLYWDRKYSAQFFWDSKFRKGNFINRGA